MFALKSSLYPDLNFSIISYNIKPLGNWGNKHIIALGPKATLKLQNATTYRSISARWTAPGAQPFDSPVMFVDSSEMSQQLMEGLKFSIHLYIPF